MPRLTLACCALLAGGLAAPWCAWGWEGAADAVVAVPGPAVGVVAGPWGDGAAIALIGASSSWVVDASGAVLATVDRGGSAGLLVDHDGDGVTDLVLCGADGIAWARGGGGTLGPAVALAPEPCAAIAAWTPDGGGRGLVTASDTLALWSVGAQGVVTGPDRFGTRLSGMPLLAASGTRFAAASVGGTEIQERSEWGRSTYTARGPVAGLAAGPRSWAWSIPAARVVEDVTRFEVNVGADAGQLRHADLDGDGLPEVLVVHPDAVGVIAGDAEVRLPFVGVRDVAAVDLDGDGCGDLAVLAEGGLHLTRGHCPVDSVVQVGGAAIEVVLDERDRRVDAYVGQPLRVQLRDPEGQDTRFSGRGGPDAFGVADDGLVAWVPEPDDVGEWTISVRMWGGADLVRVVPIRLVVHLAPERGGPTEPNRLVLGEEPATVQVIVGETAVIRLRDGVGDATTWRGRGGPSGLQIRPDGLARYTAVQEDTGEWRVDLRLTGPSGKRRTSFTLRVAPRAVVTAHPDSPAAAEAHRQAATPRQTPFLQPRGCMVTLGFAGGVTGTTVSWQTVGRAVYGSFSPVVAATCEGGAPGGLQWFAGAESAPLYAYVLSPDAIGVHTFVGTVGISFGGEGLRLGPYFSGGILMTGAGVRLWWVPFLTRGGIPHGFEIRAAWVFASTPSAQAMLMYGWRFGRPR